MLRGSYEYRVHADLIDEGWRVSVNTVADSMRRQGLAGRKPKRRRPARTERRRRFQDLLRRGFGAAVPNQKWRGDITATDTPSPPMRASCTWPRCWFVRGGVCCVQLMESVAPPGGKPPPGWCTRGPCAPA